MLSINNRALPLPGTLRLELLAPEGGSWLGLMHMKASWPGLTAAQVQALLQGTEQSFTLGCPDPRSGVQKGFTSRLTTCGMQALGGGLYQLELESQEIA